MGKKNKKKELDKLEKVERIKKNIFSSFSTPSSFESVVVGELHNISLSLAALVTEMKYMNDSIIRFSGIVKELENSQNSQTDTSSSILNDMDANNFNSNAASDTESEDQHQDEISEWYTDNEESQEDDYNYDYAEANESTKNPSPDESKSVKNPSPHEKWLKDELNRLIENISVEEMAARIGIKKKSYLKRLNILRKTGEISQIDELKPIL